MISKREIMEGVIDVCKAVDREEGRTNTLYTVTGIQSTQIADLLELSMMQSMQIDALMEYLGVEIKVESTPAKEDVKVVKIKKEKK